MGGGGGREGGTEDGGKEMGNKRGMFLSLKMSIRTSR